LSLASSGRDVRSPSIAAVALICLLTVIRIALTHAVFSPTWDEPLHVAAGWQFLAGHRYTKGTDNPPLARAAFAWPLRHARPAAADGVEQIGQIYESAGDYMKGVVASRRGNLIFVVLAIVGVFLFAADLFDDTIGVLAALLFAMLPTTLAHGGLATPDMAGTAAFALAMFAMSHWLRESSWPRTIVLGLAIAFVLLTKFTFAGFFVAGALMLMIARKRWPVCRGCVAGVIALALCLAVYASAHAAPRFLLGAINVIRISGRGHDAYLLGEVRHTGWWYYFPVVLFVKTPLSVLILAALGLNDVLRPWSFVLGRTHEGPGTKGEGRRLCALIALSILAIAMTSRADLGVRHILPIYVPLSILAAQKNKWASIGYAWLIAGSFLAHPDYLPWMNVFGGPQVVVDSNFDWGQDVVRLRDACRTHDIDSIGVELFGTADLKRIGMPPAHDIDPYRAAPGWYAVSESFIVPAQVRDPRAYRWLTDKPFERIGRTIRLYHAYQ
jgi:hypothetical protein